MADDETRRQPGEQVGPDGGKSQPGEQERPRDEKALKPGEKNPVDTLAAATQLAPGEPDVLLDVPDVSFDELSLEVDNLQARVSLHAALAQLVSLDVGADVGIGRVKLSLKGVHAQALLKVRLEKVYAILDRALTTIEAHPEILQAVVQPLGHAIEDVGAAAKGALGPGGVVQEATRQLGGTVQQAVSPGGAVSELTGGVGRTAETLGGATGQALGNTTASLGSTAQKALEPGGAVSQVGAVAGGVPRTAGLAGAPVAGPGPDPTSAAPVEPRTVAPGPLRPPSAPGTVRPPTTPQPASEPQPPGGHGHQSEVISLFDGSPESFERWKLVGSGILRLESGEMHLRAGPEVGLVYYAARRFDDVRFRLQFRPDSADLEMGLAVRFQDPREPVPDRTDPSIRYPYDNPAFVAIHTGFEARIGPRIPGASPGTFTGIVFGSARGAQSLRGRGDVQLGGWNQLEVTVHGESYTVRLNDQETSQFFNVDAWRGVPAAARPDSGYVGVILRRGMMTLREVRAEVVPREGAEESTAAGALRKESEGAQTQESGPESRS